MINSLLINRNPYFWTAFHIGLGVIATLSKWPFIIWFFICFFITLTTALRSRMQTTLGRFIALTAYLVSFELLARMCKTSPYIPYETSKYLLIFFCSLGVFFTKYKPYGPGLAMIALIFPAFLYDLSGLSGFTGLVFNGFAPLGLAISAAYLGNIKLDLPTFNSVLRLIWYASLASLSFVFFKTPDFDTISFGLGANFETTGGESSNQVSSVLGLGMVLSFYSWLFRLNYSGHRIGDLLIMLVFGFQGLLTFSRGGIFVGVIAIFLIYFLSDLNYKTDGKKKNKLSYYYLIITATLGLITFQQVDKISGGKLTLRYQGETEGTLIGHKEKNLNIITTNRLAIFLGDLELWKENFLGGVGVGASKHLRTNDTSNPHVELSRLLAEHGVPGLLYFVIIIYLGVRAYKQRTVPQLRTIMLTLFFIGLLTSFHSAMRTYITPLLIALSTITPINQRNKI